MGVKGLQYFVEQGCSDVCYKVSIKQMSDRHRQMYPEFVPVLVVDGMSLINKLYSNLDWVCGGQWKQFVTLLQDFVRSFDDIGVRLVFFFDGSVCPEKRQEWVSRRLKKCHDIEELFTMIKRTGRQPHDLTYFQAPGSMGTLTRFALKYGCGAEVYSTTREADLEVSEYAVREKAVFAILAQDSDFLIYDTKPYISATHLDMRTLTSILYDRQRFASKVSLNVQLLPLLSSLLGNDVISVDIVKPFHRTLCAKIGERNTKITTLLPLVSNLINRNHWRGNFHDDHELRIICRTVFGDDRNVELLRDALKFYWLESYHPQEQLGFVGTAYRRHVNCENLPVIYNLLNNLEYESSEVMEDATDFTLPSTNIAFRSIRQRAYSILLKSSTIRNPGQRIEVKEWCAVPGYSLSNPEIIKPLRVCIQGIIPSLEELWFNHSMEIKDIKVQYYTACLGSSLQASHLLSLQPQYVALCCILNYLLAYGHNKRSLLAPWEVVAFLAQAVCLQTKSTNQLYSLQVLTVDTRAMHLASLFMRGVVTMAFLSGVCGYPFPIEDFMPWKFFDGKLFHSIYLNAKQGVVLENLCENKVELIEEVYRLLSLVTLGTPMANMGLH